MTNYNGMDEDEPIFGTGRTILNLQKRIRLLEGMLQMALDIMQDLPLNPVRRRELQEIEREVSHVVTQNVRNSERRAAWSLRYFALFGIRPLGNLQRHRRCCAVDDFQRIARKK